MLKKQKKVKWIGIAAVAVVVMLAIAILGGRQSGKEQKNDPSVRNAVVEKGTIEMVVNGSGVLISTEAEFVRIPDGVVVEELLVSVGESVPQGGKLAAVDEDSVHTAIEATQTQLTSLATQLEGKKNDTKENSIKAGVSGRVKQIYAEVGEQVATVVAEHGGLMVLSLDGKMALKLNTSDTVKVGDSVSVILSNGSEKKGTVEKILALSRIESQSILTDITHFNLTEQLRQTVILMEGKLTGKQLDIQLNLEECFYTGNEALLKEVWINLLDNEIKFSPVAGEIKLSLHKVGDNLQVMVQDYGVGMDESSMSYIFDQFYQGDISHKTEGNGLGLALVKKIIDLHNGKITVDSSLDQGSFFFDSIIIINEYIKFAAQFMKISWAAF